MTELEAVTNHRTEVAQSREVNTAARTLGLTAEEKCPARELLSLGSSGYPAGGVDCAERRHRDWMERWAGMDKLQRYCTAETVEQERAYCRCGHESRVFVVTDLDAGLAYVVDLAAETCDCGRERCKPLAATFHRCHPWYLCGTPFLDEGFRRLYDALTDGRVDLDDVLPQAAIEAGEHRHGRA